MLEEISNYDDDLMTKYLDEGDIDDEEMIVNAIRKGTIAVKMVPVLCGSAFKNKGVQRLLDAIIRYLPSPVDVPAVEGHHPDELDKDDAKMIVRKADDKEPFAGLAFKIMTDPYVGRLTFVRAYSGTLEAGSYVYNANTGKA